MTAIPVSDSVPVLAPTSVLASSSSIIPPYLYPTMAIRELRDYTQHLCGRIKTIIDASVADPRQNKAVKDLVHAAFWTEHYVPAVEWCNIAARLADVPEGSPTQCRPCFPFNGGDSPLPTT